MRISIFLILSMFAYTSLLATEPEITPSEITKVTVFQEGAQIFRSGKVQLQKGNNTIVFEGISPSINPNSIQIKSEGRFTMLDVKYTTFYPKPISINNTTTVEEIPDEIKAEINKIEDELVYINFDLAALQHKDEAINKERSMLLQNKLMNNQGRSDSLAILKEAIAFFDTQISVLDERLIKNQKDRYEINKRKLPREKRLNELKKYKIHEPPTPPLTPKHQIIIDVFAKSATTGTIEANYLVINAGWSPAYDIRVADINQAVNFTHKSLIYQNTGNNWENIQLVVSTNNPNKNHTRPNLSPDIINFYSSTILKKKGNDRLNDTDIYEESLSLDEVVVTSTRAKKMPAVNLEIASSIATVSQNVVSVEYEIEYEQTIPSDGKVHTVLMQDHEIAANYKYYCVPKLDYGAYLTVKVPDWGALNLLSGPANLFLGNTYVGRSQINSYSTTDTLLLSLGRDENIKIERKKLKNKTESGFLKNKKTDTRVFEITVRNAKTTPINLVVLDQVPITQEEDISVALLASSGADFNKEDGELKWDIQIASNTTKKIEFSYQTKYPKDKRLVGQ